MRQRKNTGFRSTRRGAAVLELAVCLPVIVVLVFASIESCTMICTTQALHAASYEGARLAIQNGTPTSEVTALVNEIVTGHGISGATVSCTPANVAAAASGQSITVSVSVPCSANQVTAAFFFGGRNLVASTTMVKE